MVAADDVPERVCLECFHAEHRGRCATCGQACGSIRARRFALVLGRLFSAAAFVIVLLLVVVASFGWLSTAWIDWLPTSLRVPAVIAVGIVALVLRGMKSQALARELDAADAARAAATPEQRIDDR